MLQGYLKITLRNIARHKRYSLINILGLTIGLACFVLIMLWVQDELSFDRFHKNADNIYLVLRGDKEGLTGVTSKMLAPALKQELPEITKATSFFQLPESFKFIIQYGDKGFEETVILAEPGFFEFFSFKFTQGNPAQALSAPNSIVITKEIAEKYFGNENALGKSLTVSGFGGKTLMKVSGIIENIPAQSSINRQIILPAIWFKNIGINFDNWDDQSSSTYIQIQDDFDLQDLSEKIKHCEIKNFPNQNTENLSYALLPITKLHLYAGNIKFLLSSSGNIKYVQIFIAIAFVILLVASINYTNLSIALSLRRSKEIGIKKTVGANRKVLIFQFLGESIFLSSIAYGLAILLVKFLLPEFNILTEKILTIQFFSLHFLVFSIIIILITSIISGSYPAIFLSSFSPIQILKDKLRTGHDNLNIRKGLVAFQFIVTVTIIVCTIIVFNQLNFIRYSNVGFEKENLLCIKITNEALGNYDVLKQELLKNPEILNISRSEPVSNEVTRTTSVSWNGKLENEEKHFWVLHSDANLADTYKFKMSQGRYFSEQFATDKTNAYVINESAKESMGLQSPLDKEINVWGRNGKIIGVVKDFHFASFHNAIEPMIFKMPEDEMTMNRFRVITIRFKSQTPDKLVSFIEKTWSEKLAGSPFNYYFYDDFLNQRYFSEIRMGTIFKYFSFLSIFIACLGLLGLVSVTSEQRRKEIGIRKTLGASISNVYLLLSKDYLILVTLSNIIAWPVAWFFMNKWLQDFAYRIDMTAGPFLLAGILALLIAMLTVSWQAIRAAAANPVESLRYE